MSEYKLAVASGDRISLPLYARTGLSYRIDFDMAVEDIDREIRLMSTQGVEGGHRFYIRKQAGSSNLEYYLKAGSAGTYQGFFPQTWLVGQNIVEIRLDFTTNSPFQFIVNGSATAITNTNRTVVDYTYDRFLIIGLFSIQYSSSIDSSSTKLQLNGVTVSTWSSATGVVGSVVRSYEPVAANRSGSLLIDTISNAHGTLIGFPTNDSQWLYTYEPWDDITIAQDYGYKFNNGSGNCLQIYGYVGIATIKLTMGADWDNSWRTSQYRMLFDGRRKFNSTVDDGSNIHISCSNDTWTFSNTGDIRVNGITKSGNFATLSALKKGDTLSFTVNHWDKTSMINGNTAAGSGLEGIFYSGIEIVDDNGTHVLDLNQTQGDIRDISGLANTLTCTVFSPAAESGYVRELGSHDGVTFDGVNDYATATTMALGSDFSITCEITTGSTVLGQQWIINAFENDSKRSFVCQTKEGFFKFTLNDTGESTGNVWIDSTVALATNTSYSVVFSKVGTVMSIAIDGGTAETLPCFAGNVWNDPTTIVGIATQIDGTNDFNGTIKTIDIQSTTFPANNRNYDFTKTTGLTVPDTISGNDATLVGFTNVFYRPEVSDSIIGYKFDGVMYASLPQDISIGVNEEFTIEFDIFYNPAGTAAEDECMILGADSGGDNRFFIRPSGNMTLVTSLGTVVDFTCNFTFGEWHNVKIDRVIGGNTISAYIDGIFQDSTQMNHSFIFENIARVSTLRANKGTIITHLAVHKTQVITNYYDFTTGDVDTIPDTVGGNHATIVSAATTGWQPLVDTQVFTGVDYPLLSSLVTSESNASYLTKYLGANSLGATISDFPTGLVIEDGEFTSTVTLTNTGITQFKNMKMLDVDATGATGDVLIIDSEVQNVTG